MPATTSGVGRPRSRVRTGGVGVGVLVVLACLGVATSLVARVGIERPSEGGYTLRLTTPQVLHKPSQAQEAVTLGLQPDGTGSGSVLVSAPAQFDGAPVTEVRLSTGGLGGAVVGHLPEGWSQEVLGDAIQFTGPAIAGASVHFRLDLPAMPSVATLDLRLSSAGATLYDRATELAELPLLQVIDVLDRVLHFPWQVAPGETVTFQTAAASPVSGQGSWTIAGTAPQVVSSEPGQPIQYQWQVPATLTPGTPVSFVGVNAYGQMVVNVPAPAVVVAAPPAAAAQVPPSLQDCTPRGFAGRVVCLCGWFPTNAVRDGFTIDGQPLGVVAASSTTILVRIPDDAQPGPRTLKGDPALGFAADESIPFVVLAARGSVDQDRLRRGQSTPLRLEVLGTTEPLDIVLTNYTPGIVQVTGGIIQIVRSSGGTPNTAERQVQGITPGAFDIGYQLAEDPCPCVTAPGTVVAGTPTPTPTPDPPPGLPPVPPATGGGTTTGPPPVPGDSTTVGPPSGPPIPGGERTPPPVPPANPPVFPPPDDEQEDDSCCGFRPDGTITFPKITDPLVPAQVAVAPRDPAVGATQVLLHSGAYFHNDADLEVDAVGLPFRFARHYKGDVQTVDGGVLGHRWDFSLNKRIVPQANQELGNNLLLERPNVETPVLWYFDGQGHGARYEGVGSEWRDVLNFGVRTPFRAFVTTYRQQPGDFFEIQRYIVEDPEAHPFANHPNVETDQGEAIFYVLRERNGARHVFNCRGQLLHTLYRNDLAGLAGAGVAQQSDSVRLSFEYEGALNPLTQNRMLSRVRDASGHVYVFSTRPIGTASLETNIDCVTRSEIIPIPRFSELRGGGRVISFEYETGSDGAPILSSVVDSVGSAARTKQYTYDHADRLATLTSPEQSAKGGSPFLVNGYDGAGRVVSQTLGGPPNQGRLTLAYSGAAISVSNADAHKTTYTLGTAGGYPVVTSRTVEDGTQGGPSWTTTIAHNGHTQVESIQHPRGNRVRFRYDGVDDPVTEGWIRNKNSAVTYQSDLSAGNLLEVVRESGTLTPALSVTSSMTYEPLFNQVASQVDGRGNVTSYRYEYQKIGDLGNPLSSTQPPLTRPDGSTITAVPPEHRYNVRGQRIETRLDGRRPRTWRYNRQGYLVEEEFESGASQIHSRDPFGRVLGVTGDLGNVRYIRDVFGQVERSIEDPSGFANVTEHRYNADGALVGTVRELKDNFDSSAGGPQASTRRLIEETRELDLLGRVLRETKRSGPDSTVFVHEYDGDGRLVLSTQPGPRGQRVVDRYNYDARGLPLRMISAEGTDHEVVIRMEYDENGNETLKEETPTRSPAGQTPAPPRVNRYEYDALDRLVAEVDPLGARRQQTLDADGNILSERVTAGSGGLVLSRTDFEWDAFGNNIKEVRHALDAANGLAVSEIYFNRYMERERSVGPAGGVSTYAYGSAGEILEVVTPAGDTTRTRYDRAGNRTGVFQIEVGETMVPGGGRSPSRKTRRVEYTHDALGRIATESAESYEARYFYDSFSNVRGTALADGTADATEYDGMGRKRRHTAGSVTRTYSYDSGGWPASLTDGRDTTTWVLDSHGRLAEERKSNGSSTQVVRDGLGNPLRLVDANGTTTTTQFNAVGQPIRQQIATSYPSMGGIPVVIAPAELRWDYDVLGQLSQAEVESPQAGLIVTRFGYDGLGRIEREDQEINGERYTFARSYSNRHLTTLTRYPDQAGGLEVEHVLDPLGRVTSVGASGSTLAAYSYDGPGRMSGRRYRNTVLTRYGHDSQFRVDRIDVSASGGSSPRSLWTNSVEYGRFGVISAQQRFFEGQNPTSESLTRMSHDTQGRLLRSSTLQTTHQGGSWASRVTSETYHEYSADGVARSAEFLYDELAQNTLVVRADEFTYDALGRKSALAVEVGTEVTSPALVPAGVDEITAKAQAATDRIDGTKSFQYDGRGNLIYDGELVYSYDHQGRLTRVEEVDASGGRGEAVHFAYDAMGRRVASFPLQGPQTTGLVAWSHWAREATHFLFDGQHVVAEVVPPSAGTAALKRRYVRGARPGERVYVESWDGNGVLHAFYPNETLQGGVAFVTDALGVAHRISTPASSPNPAITVPNDHRVIEGTTERAPYLSWTTRVDGFAGTKHNEITGTPTIDYRDIRSLGDSAAMQNMRQSVAAAMDDGYHYLELEATIVLAAMTGGALLSGGFSNLTWSGVARGAAMGSVTEVAGGAAGSWMMGETYSKQQMMADAGMGAVFGLVGAKARAKDWGVVGSRVTENSMRALVYTTGGVAFDGLSLGDAWARGSDRAAFELSFGLGLSVIGKAASHVGTKLSRRGAPVGSGSGPAAHATRMSRTGRPYEYGGFLSKTDDPTKFVISNGIRRFDDVVEKMLTLLEDGTTASRLAAEAIRSGKMKLRLAMFGKNSGGGMWDSRYPDHIFVDASRLLERGDGYKHVAAVIMHEATHAFGGGEFSAFVAQARFMMVMLSRDGARRGSVLSLSRATWLSDVDKKVLRHWWSGRRTRQFDDLANYISSKLGYGQPDFEIQMPTGVIVNRQITQKWGGFEGLLKIDPAWASRRAIELDGKRMAGSWE